MRRIKLNDRVAFPLYLDINDFLQGSAAKILSFTEAGNEQQIKEKYMGGSVQEFDKNQPKPEPTSDRPYVYELYAVLIHRGSAMGGHYYAYIKVPCNLCTILL